MFCLHVFISVFTIFTSSVFHLDVFCFQIFIGYTVVSSAPWSDGRQNDQHQPQHHPQEHPNNTPKPHQYTPINTTEQSSFSLNDFFI